MPIPVKRTVRRLTTSEIRSASGMTGAEVAAFAYEIEPDSYRVSLRSCEYLNVSDAAAHFGGGGHVRAAGCGVKGSVEEVYAQILAVLKTALENTRASGI